MTTKTIRHYLQFKDFSLEDYEYVLERTGILKRKFKNYETYHPLHDRTLAMIFEPTRTRLSFEAGIFQLGGHAVFMSTRDTQLGRGEPVEDSAQVISRMVDIIMIRTFEQDVIKLRGQFPRAGDQRPDERVPPCQVLADIFTYYEHRGPIAGKTVAWVGDANNMLYVDRSRADPRLQAAPVHAARLRARHEARVARQRAVLRSVRRSERSMQGADLVTTDVWTSMGFEAENEARKQAFADWCVDEEMMGHANPEALFMHCLPAHRGEEVTAGVIDGPQSVVWDEAENRLHVQKALMEFLLLGRLSTDAPATRQLMKAPIDDRRFCLAREKRC